MSCYSKLQRKNKYRNCQYFILQIPNPLPDPFDIVTHIQNKCCHHIKHNRKAHGQKRGIDKEKPDLADRHIKPLCDISTNPKTLFLKIGDDALEHDFCNYNFGFQLWINLEIIYLKAKTIP